MSAIDLSMKLSWKCTHCASDNELVITRQNVVQTTFSFRQRCHSCKRAIAVVIEASQFEPAHAGAL
jgi:hypothetical protein